MVIAIIAILAALLLPALSVAKTHAQSTACQNNLYQLELCLQLYVTDNHDYFVPNNSIAVAGDPNASASTGLSWLPDLNAVTEIDPSNIINGLLFQYNRSLAIYHCPADYSTLQTPGGQPLPHLRWRSYNMSQSINGDPEADPLYFPLIPAWTKYTAVRQPDPRIFSFSLMRVQPPLKTRSSAIHPSAQSFRQTSGGTCHPTGICKARIFRLLTAMSNIGNGKCQKHFMAGFSLCLPRKCPTFNASKMP